MDDEHSGEGGGSQLAWMTGMDDWHGRKAWMTGIDDWQDLMDYPRLLKIADLSHFYKLFTDGQTDKHWYLLSCYCD